MLRFWQQDAGLRFDHALPVRRGQKQYRHDALVVRAARINAPTVGHHDPADLFIVVDIVSARGAAEHVL
jgi:hypothetical protein